VIESDVRWVARSMGDRLDGSVGGRWIRAAGDALIGGAADGRPMATDGWAGSLRTSCLAMSVCTLIFRRQLSTLFMLCESQSSNARQMASMIPTCSREQNVYLTHCTNTSIL